MPQLKKQWSSIENAMKQKPEQSSVVDEIRTSLFSISSSMMGVQSPEYKRSAKTLAGICALPQSNARDLTIQYIWKQMHEGPGRDQWKQPIILFCKTHNINYDSRRHCHMCPSFVDRLKLENDTLRKQLAQNAAKMKAESGHRCIVLGKCSGDCRS